MSEVLAIRPHDPRVNRFGMLALALVACGSFLTGVVRQVAEAPDRYLPSVAEAPPSVVMIAEPLPAAAPTLQVAAAEPPVPRANPVAQARPEPAPIAEAPTLVLPPIEPAAPATDTAATDATTVAPAVEPPAPVIPEPTPAAEAPGR